MLTKFLCKIFKLISKKNIDIEFNILWDKIYWSQGDLKKKYDTKQLTEWTYYKKLWKLKGRLSMLQELIKLLR